MARSKVQEPERTAEARVYVGSGEAARRLGISKQTFLRAVKRGEIQPGFRTPGGYLRFLIADVQDYARQLSLRGGEGHSP